jgi:hypothetical protein
VWEPLTVGSLAVPPTVPAEAALPSPQSIDALHPSHRALVNDATCPLKLAPSVAAMVAPVPAAWAGEVARRPTAVRSSRARVRMFRT